MMRHLLTLLCCLTASLAHAATGILELDSKPGGAEVFVDGKKKGTTPETEGQKLTMALAEGDDEVVNKQEYRGSTTKKKCIGERIIQSLTPSSIPETVPTPLSMKFVPVPGTQIVRCVHRMCNKEYGAYGSENN